MAHRTLTSYAKTNEVRHGIGKLLGIFRRAYARNGTFEFLGPQHGAPGGTLIFSYMRRLGSFLGGQNFEFSIFLGGFRKMNNFLGIKILWIFFGGHHKIGLYLGIISMHFRVFFKVKVQNGGYFLVLEIPDIFLGGER